MCNVIAFAAGHIETVAELERIAGPRETWTLIEPRGEIGPLRDDECLCWVNVPATLGAAGYTCTSGWEEHGVDWFATA